MKFSTRKIAKSALTALVATTIAATSLVAPAQAGGSFSLTILPAAGEDAQALRAGMQIFNLINALEANGGVVRQNGMNNGAMLGQNGNGNFGTIWQQGNGHSANLQQNGNNNAYGIYQFGEDTDVDVSQFGNGQTGATFVFGF